MNQPWLVCLSGLFTWINSLCLPTYHHLFQSTSCGTWHPPMFVISSHSRFFFCLLASSIKGLLIESPFCDGVYPCQRSHSTILVLTGYKPWKCGFCLPPPCQQSFRSQFTWLLPLQSYNSIKLMTSINVFNDSILKPISPCTICVIKFQFFACQSFAIQQALETNLTSCDSNRVLCSSKRCVLTTMPMHIMLGRLTSKAWYKYSICKPNQPKISERLKIKL